MRWVAPHTAVVCLWAANMAKAQSFSNFDTAAPTPSNNIFNTDVFNTDIFNTGIAQPTTDSFATPSDTNAGFPTDPNSGGVVNTDATGGRLNPTDATGGGLNPTDTGITGTGGATETQEPFPPTFTTPSYGIPDLTPTNPPNDPNLWPQVPATFDMWCEDYVNYKGINCYNGPRPNTKCNILYGNQNTDNPTPGCTPDRCCRSAKVKIPCKDSPYVTCTGKDLKANRKCVKTAQPINNKEACGNLRCCSNRPRPTDCYTYITKNQLECGIISPGVGWQGTLQNKACWESPRGTVCSLDYCCGELQNAIDSMIGGQR
eukprot:comp18604_c0_seq2/m.20171 comp18604_c0_seq2/g.20171  ORF comp18604_c0_seq2/g.20171 comp18604_c0_seq2/m.20171 type:complete len:316 (-) comp18604_c0_seq2:520-1467(-)